MIVNVRLAQVLVLSVFVRQMCVGDRGVVVLMLMERREMLPTRRRLRPALLVDCGSRAGAHAYA